MQNYSSDELNEIFQTLPEELKDAIVSVDTAKIINDTGKKYGLHVDQIGAVANQTGLVLLGIVHPTEFVSAVTKAAGIERVVASQIASDINDKIFLKVREILQGVTAKKTEEEPAEENGPRPLRDALLQAIENPEGLTKKPVPPKPAPIPLVEIKDPYAPTKATAPVMAPIPIRGDTTSDERRSDLPVSATPSILEQKMSGQVDMTKTEVKIEEPQTGGKKIDPYREQF
ncbi:MAG: hypothetical protein HY226_06445 [Candidatus Vogelbacteria bacterium]|nr:hypothetical protein [Candidatus Vogelbacteria bacterium]